MSEFEKWFKSLNENGRVTYFLGQEGRISEEAWNHQQSKIDELTKQRDSFIKAYEIEMDKSVELQKRIDEYKKLTTSIRNEFDLWSDDSEFADVIEAQIENLEALRGAND